ncbi:MAG TPA: hypothetical protein DDX98_05950 [Bacteroidales bacterium]|jgi:hypothetical protein|nr:hypothetical protein [Bacteroidales bacterium]
MVELIPISVKTYSGYKADEYPQRFIWAGIDFEVIEIIDRWYEGYGQPNKESVNYFKVKTDPAATCLLRHNIQSDDWFLVV